MNLWIFEVCMCCLIETLFLSVADALFCRYPNHIQLGALLPRGKRLSAGGHQAAMADHPSGPQAASTHILACQSKCSSCQKAAACWHRPAAGWGCQQCSSWLGSAACCGRLYLSLGQQHPFRPGGGCRTAAARWASAGAARYTAAVTCASRIPAATRRLDLSVTGCCRCWRAGCCCYSSSSPAAGQPTSVSGWV